jgi:predicted ArsR family transcriptional regulator
VTATLDQLPETRRLILQLIKERGGTTASEVAARLGVSVEAARQQLTQLQTSGWVEARNIRERGRMGRPSTTYTISVAGENLFPKMYDELLMAIVHATAETFGPEAPESVWAALADARTRGWQHLQAEPEVEKRVEALRDLYARKDPYVRVTAHPDGYDLVELNCPFLNVALQYPALCSTSVNLMSRVLDRRVVREKRFQDGDGMCVFRVYANEVVSTDRFEREPPKSSAAHETAKPPHT